MRRRRFFPTGLNPTRAPIYLTAAEVEFIESKPGVPLSHVANMLGRTLGGLNKGIAWREAGYVPPEDREALMERRRRIIEEAVEEARRAEYRERNRLFRRATTWRSDKARPNNGRANATNSAPAFAASPANNVSVIIWNFGGAK